MVTKKKEETSSETISPEVKVRTNKKCCGMDKKFWILVAVIVLIVVGYYAWIVYSAQPSQADAQKMAEQQIMSLVSKVRRHMILPDKEIPQVAEIKDAALAAKEEPSLAGSQNGDVLLFYPSLSKAIVYSPDRDIIVNVVPVQVNDDSGQNKATSSGVESDNSDPKKK